MKISGEGVNVSRHSDLSRSVVMTCHAGLRISYWGVSARTDGGLAYGVIGRLHGAGEDAGVVGLLEETELPLSDDVQLSANDGGMACADIGEVGSSSPSPSSGRGSGLCLGAWGVESKLLDMSFFHILLLLRGVRGSRR